MTTLRRNYDAIIVGARCAGAPTAMLLARVLLVDRATFPSDSVSGHAIRPPGTAYLKRWGLLDTLLATGVPPIYTFTLGVGDRTLPPPPPDPDNLPMLGPRRTVLDTILVDAASTAGAEVHEATSVSEVLIENDRVVGVQARSAAGRPLRAHAPIVIGADGKQSFVAQQVGAAFEVYQPPVSFAYYTYWSGVESPHAAMCLAPGRAAGMLPTHDEQVLVFVQVRWSERHAFRQDVMGNYVAMLHSIPPMARALDGARHDETLRGMLDLPAFFRQPYGPGWALVGDAAHHKDPIIARGISDAFRDADLVARAVLSGLGGESELESALAWYKTLHDEASRTVNAHNHRLAEFPDDVDELQTRLTTLLAAEAAAEGCLAERIDASRVSA